MPQLPALGEEVTTPGLPPIGGEVVAPNFSATNEPPSPSLWARANTPLVPQIADAAHAIADHLDAPAMHRSKTEAQIRGFFSGATGAAGDVAASFTSPIGIALTLAGLSGESAIAKSVPAIKALLELPAVQALQKTVQATSGAAFAGEGATRMVNEPTIGGKAQGLVELATGAAGVVPGATAAARAAEPIVTSPLARKVAAGMVKSGVTGAGAYLAGAPGAIAGQAIGEEIASAIRPKPTRANRPKPTPPAPPDAPPPVAAPPAPSVASPAAPVAPAPVAVVPTEFEAAQAARANNLPDQKALNEASLAARRAAYRARQASAPAAAAEPVVAASGKMQLTAAEMKEFTRLVSKGTPLPDALEQVKAMRDLASRLGGPSAAEAAQTIAKRRYKS